MEYLIILFFICVSMAILGNIFKVNMKKIKKLSNNKKLDELASKFPENTEMCKKILKKLNNENVKVVKNEDTKETMYIALNNTIQIGSIDNTYTRIQTVAHECLHSIQDRKILMFNFIYSNIYVVYFLITTILLLFNNSFIVENALVFTGILIIMAMLYYVVRSYLEIDAMTKARYLAKEYMQEENIINNEEIDEMINAYDRLNDIGIKATNYSLFVTAMVPVIIFALICYFK